MRIAVWHNLPSGGAKRALYYHVRGLAERGHTLESWSLSTADHTYLPLQPFAPEHVVPFAWKPKNSSGAVAQFFGFNGNDSERMRAFDEACRLCAQEIDAGGFDVLFANSSVLYYMPFIVRHSRLPKVLYLQEPFRPLYEANPSLPWIAQPHEDFKPSYRHPRRFIADFLRLQPMRVQAREEWVNARSCDLILVNSYYSRESVLRVYGGEAKVCYLGIDTNLFRNLHKPREGFIVGLGSFDRIKGIDVAIKSISLLPEPRPPLVWVSNSGEEAYINEMTRMAESLSVNMQIKMRVSDEELVDILNRAALLLYTSRLEPFGLAPLEANACATPVVAIAEGGVRETIKDGVNGFLVDNEPEGIADALNKLLSDPPLARRIGENAARHVQQEWSVAHSVERLEARLFQAVSAKPSPAR